MTNSISRKLAIMGITNFIGLCTLGGVYFVGKASKNIDRKTQENELKIQCSCLVDY